MASYRDRYVLANGLNLHYQDWGDPAGQAVLLLHGTTSNGHSWDVVSESLVARGLRAIALDCRNHGESDSSPDPTASDELDRDVIAVVDALDLGRVGLIGHSMGGRQAMAYAGVHPDRIAWLVIEDMAPTAPAGGSARVASTLAAIPESFSSLDALIAWQRELHPHASDGWLLHKALTHRRPLKGGAVALKYVPVAGPGAPRSLDLWRALESIVCPTLLIRGQESDILDDELVARMLTTLPDGRAVTVPRAGHSVHEDNPDDFLQAIATFLNEVA